MKIKILIFVIFISSSIYSKNKQIEINRKATVKIIHSYLKPNFCTPWKMKSHSSLVGSGVIIKGNKILTNAHVVSDGIYTRVQKENDPKKYDAEVLFISHESDLAVITVKDKSFFKNTEFLEIGDIPELKSIVAAYGYPVGGKRISISEGVVSRIEVSTYSHDANSNFLVIQIDAAINPGNSGGPVIQKDKIVGIAFQIIKNSNNIGYIIPVTVIQHFLNDIKDGRYDGFPKLGILTDSLENKNYRSYLNMKKNESGIIITRVIQRGSACKYLKKNDVILKIENKIIANDKSIKFLDGRIKYTHLISSKQVDENIRIEILRDKKRKIINFKLKKTPMKIPDYNQYNILPDYYIYGGIIFQPLSKEYFKCWGKWWYSVDLKLLYTYFYNVIDKIGLKKKQFVVINRVLPDEANTYISEIHDKFISKINGVIINSLSDVEKAFNQPEGKYHIIKIDGIHKPLLLNVSDMKKSNQRILKNYNIPALKRIRAEEEK